MHELAITQDILQIAIEEARRAGATRIKVIRLKIGELTHVVADSVQFYLDALAPGSIAEGVRLETTSIPVGATCGQCDTFFLVQEQGLVCPACGCFGSISQGRELSVESLEVDR